MFFKLFFLLIPLLCTHAWHNNPLLRQDGEQGKENYCGIHDGVEESREMLNEWTVVVDGDEVMAKYVAVETGFIYVGPVLGFSNTYIFEKPQHSIERRTFPNTSSIQFIKHRQVKWSQQMFVKLRAKRHLVDQELFRAKRVGETEEKVLEKKDLHNRIEPIFNDELWEAEWYLQDSQNVVCSPRLDLNVLPVYEMGYNGHGVRVSILDDGIEHQHTDLKVNYDPEISWDCNDRDEDPSPRLDDLQKNSHGTRCAGEIAMAANNKKCGVGVAWGARIGGVRMLDGKITDRVEAEAISYAWDKVDIYSVSWGPYDDGRTVEGPGELALEAILRGIHKGRNGKGNIYVWANGNGGGKLDNCNCDGYSASIYTISVGSASQQGRFPWYGEVCSSTLATAYSSGASEDQKIATTDTNNSCTLSHTGTSAAAPLAAGIMALVLQANPNLTWRDVQHLIVWTSDYTPLFDNPGWQANGVGLLYNIRFGFGLLNAGALVTMARQWVNVPDKHVCKIAAPIEAKQVQLGSRKTDVINVMVKECPIKFIEHVEVIVNIEYTRRGALEIYLASPEGTAVQLLSPRPYDRSSKGFVNWSLMSVATWGENPSGNWQINILERTHEHNIGYVGSLTLVIHGSVEMPNSSLMNSYLQSKYDFEAEEHLEMEQENDNLINAEYRDAEDHTSNVKDIDQELLRYHHKITYN